MITKCASFCKKKYISYKSIFIKDTLFAEKAEIIDNPKNRARIAIEFQLAYKMSLMA